MTTILLFIIVLGLLVFVHELGHFLVARRHGITAHEFGFGFPPRLCGFVFDETTGRYRFVWGNREVHSKHTVYSINWIPLGGFVRIKGEDGSGVQESDSFAGRSAWIRVQVLAAGVVMNFILAWVLVSIVLMIGFPRAVEPGDMSVPGERHIQISEVKSNTPAEAMGLQFGDVILSIDGRKFASVEQVQQYIALHKGEPIVMRVERGQQTLNLTGTPRTTVGENEGALGIALGETVLAQYPFFQALWEGAKQTYFLTLAMINGIAEIFKSLFGFSEVGLEAVSGPLGIAYLTKQVSDLGLAYLLYFAAILSINLGIINILPFPALDGGRVFFVLLETLKGRPVSQKVEGWFHQFGFVLLLFLMVLVTVHDFQKFKILEKIQGLF